MHNSLLLYLLSAPNETNPSDDNNELSTGRNNQQSAPEVITRIENPYYGEEEEAGKMRC